MKWLLILLAGCASVTQGTYTPRTTHQAQLTREECVVRVVQWCARNGFNVTTQTDNAVTATSDLRVIEGRGYDGMTGITHQRLAIDCGGPPAGGRGYARKVTLTVTFVSSGAMTATDCTSIVTVDDATWRRDGCVSTGLIESSLWEGLSHAP